MEKPGHDRVKYCRNCQHPMLLGAVYCEQCGQKYTTGRVSFLELFREFLDEIFSLDSKIFRTTAALFRPGKLTNEYFAGRHRRYVHPIRLFFLTSIVFFALLSLVVVQDSTETAGLSNIDKPMYQTAFRSKFTKELEEAKDSLRQLLAETPNFERTLDSLLYLINDPKNNDQTISYFYLTDDWSVQDTSILIDYQDILSLSRDSFFTKYHIEGVFAKTIVKQNIRLQGNMEDFLSYLMGQMIWMVLLMMPILALILKVLYIRRKRYYIEHLIFSFHYHAFGFVLFSLPLLLAVIPFSLSVTYINIQSSAYIIASIILVLYLFIAMRRVYGQGFSKTLIKYGTLNFLYIFVFAIMTALVFGVSAILF